MNSKLIASTVIAFSALTGASAFAQGNLYGEAAQAIQPVASSSSLTRAEVQARAQTARENGEVFAQRAVVAAPVQTGYVSRAEVRNDAVLSARLAQVGNSTI